MSDLVRVGLIGLGTAGLRHATAIKLSKAAVVVAAADPSSEAEKRAEELGIQHFAQYEEMLEDSTIDAVAISLPHKLLYESGVFALRQGKHLLMEKPMALSAADAQQVTAECRRANLRLMVNFAHRFRTECRQAYATIRSGAIGQPVMAVDVMASGSSDLPNWVWNPDSAGGGMMMYNGIHSVDRLVWLMGSPVASVSAVSGTFSYDSELEDNLVGALTFSNGTIGAVLQHKSRASSTQRGWRTLIYGTRGSLELTGESGLEVWSEKEHNHLTVENDNHFLGAWYEFTQAIRESRDPEPSGTDGVTALRTILALYESADKKAVVPIPRTD